ncbi:NAD(P)H-dependent oxidoreductase [Mycetocola reblochoni]|uniref:NADPH-dependent FMN reductase-like domain-containing protein n=2 Tax=Mycetocola reblochoni TaxID=331618 RepID=A0A3L6ZKE0_9MICO|nr:NAD(P)H-dependent oxidoreductase [Mycetocola reblochoni]RLP68446.1 hypothetical protein D9V30_10740 [Mycetocola reblochoni]SJN35965.1 putative reductase [Mycetocola reblochoni REB411]
MSRLMIVMGSIRPGRTGLPVSLWALDRAEAMGAWQSDLVDLLDFAPLMSEGDVTTLLLRDPDRERWRRRADRAEAVLWVSGSPLGGYSAALATALEHIGGELAGVPFGSVLYGAAGDMTAAAHGLRRASAALGMRAVADPVLINGAAERIEHVAFRSTPQEDLGLRAALDALHSAIG